MFRSVWTRADVKSLTPDLPRGGCHGKPSPDAVDMGGSPLRTAQLVGPRPVARGGRGGAPRRVGVQRNRADPADRAEPRCTRLSDDEDTALVWPPPAADLAALEYLDTIHGVPDPSGIWLQADGTIRLEAAVGTPGQVVTRLGILLKALLPAASAPANFWSLRNRRVLLQQAETSAQEFIETLTYFARPDDSQEIRALVARVLEARLAEERTRTLQALTDRARQHDANRRIAAGSARKPLPVRRLLVVGGCVAGGVDAHRPACGSSCGRPLGARRPAGSGRQAPDCGTPRAKQAGRRRFTGDGNADRTPGTSRRWGVARTCSCPRPGEAVRNGATRVTSDAPSSAPAATTEARHRSSGGERTGRRSSAICPRLRWPPDALAAPALGVYSSAHPDVVPPTLIRAQMPQAPIGGVPIIGQGALEIVVGDDGQVVSARLVPHSNRYQDRMMVSAAKTWRFAPARRYGQPVRYRLQMPITW